MSNFGTINGKAPRGNILVVNTGSITTKFAYYKDGEIVLDQKLEHSVEELSRFADVMDQDGMRTAAKKNLLDHETKFILLRI